MQTTITKARDGWEAETRITLTAQRSLKIDTRKGSRGVQTTATVIEPTDQGFKWSPMSDFSETLREGKNIRCTEKSVREEHAQALADIEAVKVRALAHYTTSKAE